MALSIFLLKKACSKTENIYPNICCIPIYVVNISLTVLSSMALKYFLKSCRCNQLWMKMLKAVCNIKLHLNLFVYHVDQ